MVNDFYHDSQCYAHYQFERGNLDEDSRRTNHLINHGVNEAFAAGDYKEGYCAAHFSRSSSQYFSISDADLCDGFPLKWIEDAVDRAEAEATNYFTFCCWLKPLSTSGTQTVIAKSNDVDKQSFKFLLHEGEIQLIWGYQGTGTSTLTINTGCFLVAGNWYHIGVSLCGPESMAHLRIWHDATQDCIYNSFHSMQGENIALNDAPITIGANSLGDDALDGILDELVIFNAERTSLEIDAIRSQTYQGRLQNSFLDDSQCRALYRFEDGALVNDSIGTNHLTNFNQIQPSTRVGLYMEGGSAAFFRGELLQYALITDSSLSDGFPLKSTDSQKDATICFWVRPSTVSGTQFLVSKTANYEGKRSFAIYLGGSVLRVLWGYSNGTQYETFTLSDLMLTAERWYHLGIVIKGSGSVPFLTVRIWDSVQRRIALYRTFYPSQEISVGDASFVIGASSTPNNFFSGYIDEVVIFSSNKNYLEIDEIRNGTYSRPFESILVNAVGVTLLREQQSKFRVSGFGLQTLAEKRPTIKVAGIGVMALVTRCNRTTANSFLTDRGCKACYCFETDPGFLVDHVSGINLIDHNTVEQVQC